MSPCHKFFCLEDTETIHSDYQKFLGEESNLDIDDDFIRYMSDTLQWVPTIHLSGSRVQESHNLNFYGSTIINKSGAKIFRKVMFAWSQVFEAAPDLFELTGSWTCSVDFISGQEMESEGYYEKLIFEKISVVRSLTKLAQYAEKVEQEKYLILHIGI